MPRHLPRIALVLAVPALLAACDRRSPQEEAAELTARQNACVADELAIAARNKLDQLETMVRNAEAEASPMAGMMRGPAAYAEAYRAFAESQRRAYALVDSAAVAAERADSVRFIEGARELEAGPPTAGGVQQNVVAEYRREFQAARGNPDHPCMQPEAES